MTFLREIRRILILLLCLSFFGEVGGNWLLLQSVAWGKMAYSFAQRETVPAALSKTFDGRHPCDLCHRIAKGRPAGEKRGSSAQVQRAPDLILPGPRPKPLLPVSQRLTVFEPPTHRPVPHHPPTPPPKS